MNNVTILDIKLYDKNIQSCIKEILDIIIYENKSNYCISASGAHGLVFAQNNKEFKLTLQSFKINLPDGMPGVLVGRLKGVKNMKRCYGPDFFKDMMIASADRKINHFLCGGKEGIAEELKITCEEKFNNYNIVGTYSPPFRNMTDSELKILADEINSKNTDIIWIGLSTPKQEIFAYRLSKFTNVHSICTVGAAFDFHTGKLRQAPKVIQNLALEWLFRLIIEPKRLWKRYFEIVPLFIYYNLKEFVIFIFKKMFGRKDSYAK